MEGTFHRRELKSPAVEFSSAFGKVLFKEALCQGLLEGYFKLAEHYQTQGHPAFCGLGSLTMALNSLLIDPKKTWQGVWRWFDESFLTCCEPLDVVKLKGITLTKLACLARCNGAATALNYASSTTAEAFREDVKLVCGQVNSDGSACDKYTVMIVSYARPVLNQSGSGHFSPIGGYNIEKDMVLIMDVARFKYPPHWIPLPLLFEAMQEEDPDAGKSRGYMLLTASSELAAMSCDSCCAEIDESCESSRPDDRRSTNISTDSTGSTNSTTTSSISSATIIGGENSVSGGGDFNGAIKSEAAEDAQAKLKSLVEHKCPYCS